MRILYCTCVCKTKARRRVHISQRFESLLEAYRRPDGQRWSGQDLHDATGGVVTRSYVTNLRKGRIENPGYEKLRAIARAVGFPPELWFEEGSLPAEAPTASVAEQRDIAGKVNYLFEVFTNERTGEPYTNAEVARMSLGGLTGEDGGLTEEEVRAIRTGEIANPSVNQVVALADVFGVQPSYFLDRSRKPLLLDAEALAALQDETTSAILHKSIHLSSRERDTILGIIQQFENLHETPDDR